MYEYTDRMSRTLADRIDDAAERRPAPHGSEQDRATAQALLADMLQAAAKHGITLDALDLVTDLPGGCYRAVGRSSDLAARINTAAERRPTHGGTERDKAAATALLADMLQAAAQHGINLDALDWVTDLPGGCLAAVTSTLRTRAVEWATAS